MIAAGAELVSDDRTELFVRSGRLCARPPKPIAGLMEIRGVGIVNVPYTEEVRVALVAELKERVARMPVAATYRPPRNLPVPRPHWPSLVQIAAHEASAPAKLAAAVATTERGTVSGIVKSQ
jgi:serine kinase of HPr protein (carbohydrate metabolism regulator)